MELEKLMNALKEAKERAKPRKFKQTVDLIVNIKNVDFSRPENRINLEVVLPNGRGKDVKIGAVVGDELLSGAKKAADVVIHANDLPKLDKKQKKKLAKECAHFLAQANVMPLVGRYLGQVLGPRGKMPTPVPPNAKLEPIVQRLKNTVRIKMKGKFVPTLHAPIGTEDMDEKALAENALAVLEAITEKLPNKVGNIKSIYVKLTMGPAIKVK